MIRSTVALGQLRDADERLAIELSSCFACSFFNPACIFGSTTDAQWRAA
jgi:hypothetical protein